METADSDNTNIGFLIEEELIYSKNIEGWNHFMAFLLERWTPSCKEVLQ